jgi:hypothetical protein
MTGSNKEDAVTVFLSVEPARPLAASNGDPFDRWIVAAGSTGSNSCLHKRHGVRK